MKKIEKGDWVRCPEYEGVRSDFTSGKLYEVLSVQEGPSPIYGYYFNVLSDNGLPILCNTVKDFFIGNKDWEVCSFKKNLKEILEE